MNTDPLALAAERIARVMPMLVRGTIDNCCILATRMIHAGCAKVGVPCRGLPVRVAILNAALLDRLDAHEFATGQRPTTEQIRAWQGPGEPCYSLGVGFWRPSGDANAWAGHLVALLDERIIIDATLGQASRPAYGIELGPVAIPATPEFLAGSERLVGHVGPCEVGYQLIQDESWLRAPDWHSRGRWFNSRVAAIATILRQRD